MFFSALLFNYLCLLGASLVAGVLAEQFLGRRSFVAAVLAGLVLIASFHASQYVVTGLTEGLNWVLAALAVLFYARRQLLPLAAVLALSVVQRETIPIAIGVMATLDLVLRRHPRRFNAAALAVSLAAFASYLALRAVIFPRPGYEEQLSPAALGGQAVDFFLLGFATPDFLMMGVVSLNVTALVALLVLRRRGWHADSLLPHLLGASAVLLFVGFVAGIGSNVGRIIGVLSPAWAAYAACFLVRVEGEGRPASGVREVARPEPMAPAGPAAAMLADGREP